MNTLNFQQFVVLARVPRWPLHERANMQHLLIFFNKLVDISLLWGIASLAELNTPSVQRAAEYRILQGFRAQIRAIKRGFLIPVIRFLRDISRMGMGLVESPDVETWPIDTEPCGHEPGRRPCLWWYWSISLEDACATMVWKLRARSKIQNYMCMKCTEVCHEKQICSLFQLGSDGADFHV